MNKGGLVFFVDPSKVVVDAICEKYGLVAVTRTVTYGEWEEV